MKISGVGNGEWEIGNRMRRSYSSIPTPDVSKARSFQSQKFLKEDEQ